MKKLLQYISYFIFRIFIVFTSLLPFSFLYLCSNCTAYFLRLISYRKTVVFKNLAIANIEPNQTLIKSIYLNFSDIIFESAMAFSSKSRQLNQRISFSNLEVYQNPKVREKGIILMGAHIYNWEWGSFCFPEQLDFNCKAMMKPIHNPMINAFVKKKRGSSGMHYIDIFNYKASDFKDSLDKPNLYVMLSDQYYAHSTQAHRIRFFNTETVALPGAANLAMRRSIPIAVMYPVRISRGKYDIKTDVISFELAEFKDPIEITQIYFNTLESIIRKHPSSWLWTHKRWKNKINY